MINLQDNTRERKLAICSRVRQRATPNRPIEAAMDLQYFNPMTQRQLNRAGFKVKFNIMRALLDVVDAV